METMLRHHHHHHQHHLHHPRGHPHGSCDAVSSMAKPASSGAHHTVSLHPLSWGRCLPKLAPLAFTAWTVGVPNMAAPTGPRNPPSATQWNHLTKAKPASVQPHPISAPCAVPAAIAPIPAWLPHPQSGRSYATRQPGAERERWPTWRWPVVISVKADHQGGSQPSSSTRILCLLEDNNYMTIMQFVDAFACSGLRGCSLDTQKHNKHHDVCQISPEAWPLPPHAWGKLLAKYLLTTHAADQVGGKRQYAWKQRSALDWH